MDSFKLATATDKKTSISKCFVLAIDSHLSELDGTINNLNASISEILLYRADYFSLNA